jgi:EAL domain-containing protein (putative c-di-GMP-specific phosphodiesterase class I)
MRRGREALRALNHISTFAYVSVNASPATVESGALARMLSERDVSRIVLEVTEQAVVSDYDRILRQLDVLRGRGMRIAVDDAGAGYAGLQQILRLRPDLIKLDMSLTRDLDADHARASLVEAMTGFARRTGAVVVAEGIETEAELAALRGLGAGCGQGYLLGRPEALKQATARARSAAPLEPAG